jgi:pteridine reductase
MELAGRVALVTGGARRIGRAIVDVLAANGMRVALHYSASEDAANHAIKQLREAGTEACGFAADLRDPATPARLIADVVRTYGGLDVLVNSAAIMDRTPIGEVTVERWDDMFALNLRAPFFLSQAAAPHLARARGTIVNIADLAAFETWRGYIPHSITKAGVVQMTRGLAHALAPDVRVNAVAPGPVLLPEGWDDASARRLQETTPLKRLGMPADVTEAVMYLLRADYVTGETLVVDGGRHIRK